MRRVAQRALLVCALGAGLAACGGNGDNQAVTPPVGVTPVGMPQENQFGSGFATDYRASVLTNPATPVTDDIIPLSLTTNPVALK